MTTREAEIQRRTALSETRVAKAVFPPTTNHHDTLFGGTALAWMDEVSFITATRFCRKPLVTVSTDRIDFNHPEDRRVPDVLLSGNHEHIRRWRLQQSLGRTAERRADLLDGRSLSGEEQNLLAEYLRQRNDS